MVGDLVARRIKLVPIGSRNPIPTALDLMVYGLDGVKALLLKYLLRAMRSGSAEAPAPRQRSRPKLQQRRSRSSSVSVMTRSSLVLSPASLGRAATRPASIRSSTSWWPSGWDSCMHWCQRPFVLPCSSIRRVEVATPRPPRGTYRKLPPSGRLRRRTGQSTCCAYFCVRRTSPGPCCQARHLHDPDRVWVRRRSGKGRSRSQF
jgi:hypothetical protein